MKNLSGQRFGRLEVICFDNSKDGITKFLCVCDCGEFSIVRRNNLISGNTKSCGCQSSRQAITHGDSNTKLYRTWESIITRCYNKKQKQYKDWGGRGITVCDRWRYSYVNFRSDMGPKPEGLTLDRIDNDGNYEPSNCRWATYLVQNNNQRLRK